MNAVSARYTIDIFLKRHIQGITRNPRQFTCQIKLTGIVFFRHPAAVIINTFPSGMKINKSHGIMFPAKIHKRQRFVFTENTAGMTGFHKICRAEIPVDINPSGIEFKFFPRNMKTLAILPPIFPGYGAETADGNIISIRI